LILLITALVGWGWSPRIAGVGLLRGLLAALCVFTISACIHAAGIPATPTAELWGSYPRPDQDGLMLETISDYSQWHTGDRNAIDLDVVGSPTPSLVWDLRNFPQARFVNQLSTGSQPSMVITMDEKQPNLTAAYRGQSFIWGVSPDWNALDIFGQLNWLVFHTTPDQNNSLVLWVRTDIFLGDPTGAAVLPATTP
jgi:hypothetical protein